MSTLIEQLRKQLEVDLGLPEREWQALSQLLAQAESETEVTRAKRWIFAESTAYVDTRVRAGLLCLRENLTDGWHILRQLVISPDPDDRSTALTILSELPSPEAVELARVLLDDPWPYLRLGAVELVKGTYPEESIAAIRGLLTNGEEWVRDRARRMLAEMHGNSDAGAAS